MSTVFIIHGAYGHPEENWLPYLKNELEKEGCHVLVPAFPTPEGHTLDNWFAVFKEHEKFLDEDTIVVGHSMGPLFLLRLLEQREKPIKAAFFVAGVFGPFNPEFDVLNESFYGPFDWEHIKRSCKRFFLFHSDNDPYVPREHSEELAQHLGVESTLIEGAGHFNEAAGYKEIPLLLESIKQQL